MIELTHTYGIELNPIYFLFLLVNSKISSDAANAVNPYIHRIPDEYKDSYMDDVMQILMKKTDKRNNTVHYPVIDILAFARKKV